MRSSIKKTIVGGGLGFLVIIGILLIVPWFLNPNYLQSLVLRHIQQTFGSHVQVGRTSLAFFPSPHFLVSDIVVKEKADSHAVFRARSMSLELGVGQLLQKKVVIKEFVLDHPEIEIRRDRAGIWRFLGHANEDSSLSSLASFLILGKFEVTNGKIIVIDESPYETVRGLIFENVTCSSDTSYEGVSVLSTLTLSGNLRQAQDFAPLQVVGTFKATSNVPLSTTNTPQISFGEMTFSGTMAASNISLNYLAEYFAYDELFAKISERLNVDSQIFWARKGETSQLQFSDVSLGSSSLSLSGNASIEGLEDGHQMTAASFRSSNLNVEMIRSLVPDNWLPEPLVTLWGQGDWGGEVTIEDARVTSSTRADVGTSIMGNFQVENGFLRIPKGPITEHVRGTVVVEPDRIHVLKTTGVYEGIPVDVTKGVLFLKDDGAWGEVEIEGMVPAEKVWNFIRDLSSSPPNKSGWQAGTVSQGNGLLRLRFSGEIFDEEGLAFQRGDYQPSNVVIHFPGLQQPLSHGHGTIHFSPDSTVFEAIEGEMGAYPFTLNGTLIHQDIIRAEPLKMTVGLNGREFLRFMRISSFDSGDQIKGPLYASVTMRGPMSRLNFKGKIDGTEAMVTIPSVLQKKIGQAGSIDFDGQFRSGGTVRFERIDIAMLPFRLQGQGVFRYRPTWGWEGRLDSGPISIGLLPEKIQLFNNALQSGILEVQLGGKGLGHDWTKWNMKGWVALTDGVVTLPGIQEPVKNVFVRLRIDKDLLDLKRMQFHVKDSEAVVTGFVKKWKTVPEVSVMWDAPQFDIDLLVPKEGRSPLRDGVEWLANHGKLKGSLFIDRPRYQSFSGEKLSAEIHVHDNLVSLEKIQTMVEKHGTVKGRLFVHLPSGKPAAVRASFEGHNLPFEKMLLALGDERRLISGQLDIQGKIQGHGRDEQGIIPTLEGGLDLSLRNGYVRQGTVLPKILRILNLPHVLRGKVNFEKTGFPYESVNATIAIKKGSFFTKDFLLRSPVMKSTVAGNYDFTRDHLDGVVAVSPFGAYSDLLKNIPLFGNIFAGERNGIATALFRLNGPLKEPQVVYMPKESLKSGLAGLAQLAFDVLKNTVLSPVKALNGDSSKASSSPFQPGQVLPKGSRLQK